MSLFSRCYESGQSSMALKAMAQRIIATDISPDMLGEAVVDSAVEYLQAPTE